MFQFVASPTPSAHAQAQNQVTLETATPIAITNAEGTKDSIFLVSNGRIASINYLGGVNWEVETRAGWQMRGFHFVKPYLQTVADSYVGPIPWPTIAATPTLGVLPVEDSQFIIAAGSARIVVLSRSGNILAEASLELELMVGKSIFISPTAPLILADFDNDHLTDVIVSSENFVFCGYVLKRRASFGFFPLLSILILIFVSIFARHSASRNKHQQKSRTNH